MRYVIIGTSAAGLAAAEMVRARDPQGSITLISEEVHLPYSRPLLTYLLGREITPDKIFLKSADYFAAWNFTPKLGQAVVKVEPQARTVHLAEGEILPFDRLLIASGAKARLPDIPGEDLPGVYTLRNLADIGRLEAGLTPGTPVAVVGGGAVGLKTAEALTQRGNPVTLIEVEPRLLPRLLDQTAAELLEQVLRDQGVTLLLEVRPAAVLERQGRAAGLALEDGREVTAGAVIFAVGVEPRGEFLAGTGLAEPEGIPVNSFLQTRQAHIYAAGDCALPRHLLTGEPTAYQIWPAAVAQGQVAGVNMTEGQRRYDGILPMNSISLKGFRLITGGHFTPDTQDGEIFTELDRQRRRYRRLVFQAGRLVGVTLVGEVEQAGIYFQIMSQKLPRRDLPVDLGSRHFHPGSLWG
ncbi:MAG: NAD(P)/FAD-dependent oxidoreductase [Desulfobaccales bacterium]